jgi:hypothetical protein
MTAAAAVIRDCRQQMALGGAAVIAEIAPPGAALCEWRHYPAGEVYDPKSHAQYFYHSHSVSGRRTPEHGHFHLFLRAEGMPAGVAPMLLPELAVADAAPTRPQAAPRRHGAREEIAHLIAIAVDPLGEPCRLFTTNRWVTGETWYRAEDVIQMLDRFVVAEAAPSELLNRWISAMIRLFRPQIAHLLRARDDTVMAWRRRNRGHVFDDPRLEVTSGLDIDVDVQLAFVDRAGRGSIADGFPGVRRLPPMADGWGEGCAG